MRLCVWLPQLVLLGACGGGGGETTEADAPVAQDAPATCPLAPGTSFIMSAFRVIAQPAGEDVDQNGTIDNAIGAAPQSMLDDFKAGFDALIAEGALTGIMHFVDWTEPPSPADPDVWIQFINGDDADDPMNPANNIDGDAQFYADLSNFDVGCNVLSQAGPTPIVDRVLDLHHDRWTYPISQGRGTVTIALAHLHLTFADDFRSLTSTEAGALTYCALAAIPSPLSGSSGTVLDVMVNDPVLTNTVAADLDLDGDGLEQVTGDGVTVQSCTDGDGTVIPGPDCSCHPAIADGYSLLLQIDAVSATLVGVR